MDKLSQPFNDGLPNLSQARFEVPTRDSLDAAAPFTHALRFLILYGSLRERSFIPCLAYEAARLLGAMGGEVRIFRAYGLPLPDDATADHTKVQELRNFSRSGPRARCGSHRSGTAPCPA